MKERYEALCELLDNLFRQLPFPMGGNSDMAMSIAMYDRDDQRLMAMVTTTGYIVVSASGETMKCRTIREVEVAFLTYFKSAGSIHATAKFLGIEV